MVQRVYHQIKKVDAEATVTIATSKTQVSAIHNQLGEDVGISVEPRIPAAAPWYFLHFPAFHTLAILRFCVCRSLTIHRIA